MFLCSLRYCLKCYFSKGVYSFPLSTVRDEQNRDILNILKYFRLGAVFLISMSEEQSKTRNGEPGAE